VNSASDMTYIVSGGTLNSTHSLCIVNITPLRPLSCQTIDGPNYITPTICGEILKHLGDAENAGLEQAGLENPGPNCEGGKGGTGNAGPCGTGWKRGGGKRGTLKVWKALQFSKAKATGAEIKRVYGGMDTPTDSDGDESADVTDASANAVVATVTTPATDSNEVERQGRGCPICRTDIQMILRLFF